MDHRVDLYAAGVILYEAVTGEVPFNADTFNELLFKIVLEEPRPVQQLVPDIDAGFAALVGKAMAREPAARFQSARDFQLALEHWANNAGPELANALRMAASPPRPGSIADGTGQFARQTPNPALGTGTPGAWANTGGVTAQLQAPAKRSNAGVIAALGMLGVLILGGGAVAMHLANKASSSAAAAVAPERSAADEKAKTDALVVAAKAQQAEADTQAEEAKQADQARKAAAERATNDAATAAAAAAAATTTTAKPKIAIAHAAAPKGLAATPKAAAAPATPTPAPASTGRKIRTSL
jgi:eukaryotic-like serine/threonine-protein kinase